MRWLAFANRNRKELLRDPLTLLFGFVLPIALLVLMSIIYQSIPSTALAPSQFAPGRIAPGISVFGLSFIMLFMGILLANDRTSSFLMRLYASPLNAAEFIYGYTLPMLPVAVVQSVLCFVVAFFFGLEVSARVLLALIMLLPAALLFIALGILIGTCFTEKQVGGVASLIINATALLGGIWFELSLIGGAYETICYILPFAHAVEAVGKALSGNLTAALPHAAVVCAYAAGVYAIAVLLFRKKMRG